MIQIWRKLTSYDKTDPAILESGKRMNPAMLPMPPARLEVRRHFFFNRVVERRGENNSQPEYVRSSFGQNMGIPMPPLLLKERRRDWAGPHHEGGERDGPQQVACGPVLHPYYATVVALWIT